MEPSSLVAPVHPAVYSAEAGIGSLKTRTFYQAMGHRAWRSLTRRALR